MRRGRVFLYLALILVIGLVAVLVFYQRLLPTSPIQTVVPQAPTPTPVETVKAVRVVQPIKRGQVIDPSMLDTVDYPKNLIPEGMLQVIEDAVGKKARTDLQPGTILTQNMLGPVSATGSDAALEVPRGLVAVSIPITRLTSVSYGPQRGDHVAVIVTLMFVELDSEFQTRLPDLSGQILGPTVINQNTSGQAALGVSVASIGGPRGRSEQDPAFEVPFYWVPSERQRPRVASQTLIPDAIVLQMGNFPLENLPKATAVATTQPVEGTPVPQPTPTELPPAVTSPDVITLIVTPQDAVTLNYLIFSGAKLTLALRGVNDDSPIQTEAVTLQFLLDQYRIPIPAKLPYGLEPRVDEVILPTPVPNVAPTPTP